MGKWQGDSRQEGVARDDMIRFGFVILPEVQGNHFPHH